MLDFYTRHAISACMSEFTPRPVPERALSRNLHLGRVAGGVLGSTLGGALGQMLRGNRPDLAAAALNPANAVRVAGGLAHLRGAAMKLGQMLSMESGAILPPEVTAILGQLQASAPAMPPAQLKTMLTREWGAGWQAQFQRFEVRPVAAASIGQVHRAVLRDGQVLAIKVQFPGVAASIDSDIATLGRLMRLPGVVPKDLDLTPLLAEARAQLHEEADYLREAQALGAACDAHPGFVVPRVHQPLCTPHVLAMEYIESAPIEALLEHPQAVRDRAVADLITLVLREIFALGQMQTDPNFANFRLAPDGRIVLLDFGATRDIAPEISQRYRLLLRALLAEDRSGIWDQMAALGYFSPTQPEARQALIRDLALQASAPLRMDAAYDFGRSTLIADLAVAGEALGRAREFWHVPPADLLFLHRKIGGIFFLAQRLQAQVALNPLVARWI